MKPKIYEDEIMWPKKGDKLFRQDGDYDFNACLNYSHDMSELYISGYKLAGDALIEYLGRRKRDQDRLVYPICFLYRQYLELRLKDIIKLGIKLYNAKDTLPAHHNTIELWILAKEMVKKAWYKDDDTDLNIIENCIKEYANIDPFSTSFRYAEDKKGNKTLGGITNINLRNLSKGIDKIASLLDGLSCGLAGELDLKESIEYEHGYE